MFVSLQTKLLTRSGSKDRTAIQSYKFLFYYRSFRLSCTNANITATKTTKEKCSLRTAKLIFPRHRINIIRRSHRLIGYKTSNKLYECENIIGYKASNNHFDCENIPSVVLLIRRFVSILPSVI